VGICPFEYRLFSARVGSRRRSSFVERRSIVDGLVFDAERLAFDPRCPNLLYLYSPATLHLFRCTYVMFLFVVVSFSPFSAPERGAGGGGRLLRARRLFPSIFRLLVLSICCSFQPIHHSFISTLYPFPHFPSKSSSQKPLRDTISRPPHTSSLRANLF